MIRIMFFMLALLFLPTVELSAQCAQAANIYTFTYSGHSYEVVKELKSWTEAATCAVERGGYLVQIDSAAENNFIMGQLMLGTAANIDENYHPVTDGGGASYIWTGGTDKSIEGTWIWDGDNNAAGVNFYTGQGTAGNGNGTIVGGAFVNWGNSNGSEPDNFYYLHDQDALGLSMGWWPHGVAGQWNDIDIFNTLYFIIEKDAIVNTCNTPLDLNSNGITTNTAILHWTGSAAIYNIKYKSLTETNWVNTNSTNDSLELTDLAINTSYNFQIQAVCSTTPGDTSSWSAISTFTTLNNDGFQEAFNKEILIFPNPASESLQIIGILDFNTNIIITNMQGKKLLEYSYSELPEGKIKIKSLAKGFYFVMVSDGKNCFIRKFSKA
jgi:hypothetical protein